MYFHACMYNVYDCVLCVVRISHLHTYMCVWSALCTQDHARVIMSLSTSLSSYELFPPEVTNAFTSLWSDAGVLECFSRAYEYQLNDSAP